VAHLLRYVSAVAGQCALLRKRDSVTNHKRAVRGSKSMAWRPPLFRRGSMTQKFRLALVPLVLLAAALFVVSPAVAAKPVTVVATINGGGTSVMTDLPAGMGASSFGFHATLFSDGSATGHFDCVD